MAANDQLWKSIYESRFKSNSMEPRTLMNKDVNIGVITNKFAADFGADVIDQNKQRVVVELSKRIEDHGLSALEGATGTTDGAFASLMFDEKLIVDLKTTSDNAAANAFEWVRHIKGMAEEVGKIFLNMSPQNRQMMLDAKIMTQAQLEFAVKLQDYARGAANELYGMQAVGALKDQVLYSGINAMEAIYKIVGTSSVRLDDRLYGMFGIKGVGTGSTINWNGVGSGNPGTDFPASTIPNNGPQPVGGEWWQKSIANLQPAAQGQGAFQAFGNMPWQQGGVGTVNPWQTTPSTVPNPWQQNGMPPVNVNPWQNNAPQNPWQQNNVPQANVNPWQNNAPQNPWQNNGNAIPPANNGWQPPMNMPMNTNPWQQNNVPPVNVNPWQNNNQPMNNWPQQQPVNNGWQQQTQQVNWGNVQPQNGGSTIPADWNIII